MPDLPRLARRLVASAILCACLVPFAAKASEKGSYQTALESITTDQLRRHVEYLADDAMEGRESGTLGGRAAADYLKDRLAELGLTGGRVSRAGSFRPSPPTIATFSRCSPEAIPNSRAR